METNSTALLAIESAIEGGSIALFINGEHRESIAGTDAVSRAEDLLFNISQLLGRHGLEPADLTRLVVSSGPGSYTGIRIGIATALGLRKALGIDAVGVSALEALATAAGRSGTVIAAVPVGRSDACIQRFEVSAGSPTAVSGPEMVAVSAIPELIVGSAGAAWVMPSSLLDRIEVADTKNISAVSSDLAYLIGMRAAAVPEAAAIEPLFVEARQR